MKKWTALFTAIILFLLAGTVFANYPAHLNGNSNFILVDGHMGRAWYVDKSSLVVQKYEPPIYIIAVNVITAESAYGNERDFYEYGGAGKIIGVKTYRFFYNWDKTAMYLDTTGHDGWRYLKPLGCWAETGISMPAGEMAFYLAYNMKFYGAYRWRSGDSGNYIDVYTNDFYARAK